MIQKYILHYSLCSNSYGLTSMKNTIACGSYVVLSLLYYIFIELCNSHCF